MEWISVEDRLPELDEGEYLVFFEGVVTMLPFIGNRWHWLDRSFMYVDDQKYVTHWMPLPEPPSATN